MPEAVRVESLTKDFPAAGPLLAPRTGARKRALSRVTFSVGPGEVFGLLGPNGAGKTTLLKILCALLEPNQGRAAVLGFDVVRQAAQAKSQLGYCPGTERSFFLRLSARENLRFYGTLNNLSLSALAERIPALLSEVGLEGVADEPARNFSTGMLQRLALARALLHQPRVLVFDEPTRSLDPAGAAWWRGYVRQELVQRSGCCVLLATHNLVEAEEVCDRMAVLDRGELKAVGTSPAICRQAGADSLAEAYALLTHTESRQEAPTAP